MLICLCVAKALLLVVIVVVFRVLRHKYGAYSLTVKCLLTNSDRIVLPICLKFTFSHSLFRDVWHVFVCVCCVCVCSCIVYFCYLRFLKTKKNNLFFYFYIESNFSLISLHTQSRSALVSCYRSLSLFLLSVSFCCDFWLRSKPRLVLHSYALSWGTFSTRISTIFTHNSRIFCCYCDASRTPQRFPLHHVFFILLFLPLSLFCCIFLTHALRT